MKTSSKKTKEINFDACYKYSSIETLILRIDVAFSEINVLIVDVL